MNITRNRIIDKLSPILYFLVRAWNKLRSECRCLGLSDLNYMILSMYRKTIVLLIEFLTRANSGWCVLIRTTQAGTVTHISTL